MSEFNTGNDMQNENVQNTQNTQSTQDVRSDEQNTAPETQQPTYQSSAYSYGRFGSEPIPDATRSGYYTAPQQAQPDQSAGQQSYGQQSQQTYSYAQQNSYSQQPYNQYTQTQQSYTQPSGGYYTAPAGQPTEPKKSPKKERRGLRTFLTAGIAAVTTAAVLLAVLWGVGVFGTKTEVETSSVAAAESSSGSSESSEPAEDAFTINSSSGSVASAVSGDLETLSDVVAKVKPSIVCIENYTTATTSSGWGYGGGQSSSEETLSGEGSGIIFKVDGDEAYILTNAHVVEDATSLKIVTVDGSTYDAYLVGSDTNTDLAVIRTIVDDQTLVAAEFGDSDELQQGDFVAALGNPGGMAFSNSATFGIVSAVNRQVTTSNGYTMSCIQTDAAINPGNSGGALVNMSGQVIGINSSKIVASGYEGLGFAISINEALPVVSDLMAYGYVKDRAYLGITYQFIDESTSRMYGLPTGVYVYSFTTDTVSSAGVEVGDILTAADGEELTSSSVLINILAGKKPGDTITFTVYRSSDRSTFEATVTVGEYSPSSTQSQMNG